jgi:hypothetical protein
MGFFSFIETFFFISLAITFILIMLLVYHFKQRLTDVEIKTDTMTDIMNNLLQEMKNIKTMVLSRPMQRHNNDPIDEDESPLRQHQNSPYGGILNMMMPFLQQGFQNNENEEANEYCENPIKIINLENDKEDVDLDDICDIDEMDQGEGDSSEGDSSEGDETVQEIEEPLEITLVDSLDRGEPSPIEVDENPSTNLKSLDISQLRALALQKGIDPAKKKKAELIQLLL